MNPRVVDVKPALDYTIILTFTNGEIRTFDVKPYLTKGIFKKLQDKQVFNAVKPFLGSIQWPNGQDFCPDTLYLDSTPVQDSPVTIDDNTLFQEGTLYIKLQVHKQQDIDMVSETEGVNAY